MNSAIFKKPWPVAALASAALLWPPARHLVLYNFLPLTLLSLVIIQLQRRTGTRTTLGVLTLVAAGAQILFAVTHQVGFEPDSIGYLRWARTFAGGYGFPGMIYRPPLYPFISGALFRLGCRDSTALMVLQHLAGLSCIPLTWWCARECGFTSGEAAVAAGLTAFNSLRIQMTHQVMTETFFMVGVLACLIALVRLYAAPSPARAAGTGLLFALLSHLRQLFMPVLWAGLAWILLTKGRKAIVPAVTALACYIALTAPWSVRNLQQFGTYGLSSSLGLNFFTKTFGYGLVDQQGSAYRTIEPVLRNVAEEAGIEDPAGVAAPETRWDYNQVPHMLMDSLQVRHGYSFVRANRLLLQAALGGVAAHPFAYVKAAGRTMVTLLFSHRELYPDAATLLPVKMPPRLGRLVRGLVYVPGAIVLLFFVISARRLQSNASRLIPFFVLMGEYGLVALLHVGLTRYTVPWVPFGAICAAGVVAGGREWFQQVILSGRKKKLIDQECIDNETGKQYEKSVHARQFH